MPRVLIVEDSTVDRKLIERLLARESNLEVLYVDDGVDALPLMEQQHFDVVLTDMMLPQMDGLELVESVQQQFPLVPIVLMTSQGNEAIAVKALRAGAASYIPKSALMSDLVETLQHVLELSNQQRAHARLIGCRTEIVCSFELQSDYALIPALVGYLQDEVTSIGLCDSAGRTRVGVALDEALVNALYHGNFEMTSDLRDTNPDEYNRLVQSRRGVAPFCDRKIFVTAQISPTNARFVIRDEGPGFDYAKLPDPTAPTNLEELGGRGVLLMRTFMDEVTFNDTGNEVTLFKRNPHDFLSIENSKQGP